MWAIFHRKTNRAQAWGRQYDQGHCLPLQTSDDDFPPVTILRKRNLKLEILQVEKSYSITSICSSPIPPPLLTRISSLKIESLSHACDCKQILRHFTVEQVAKCAGYGHTGTVICDKLQWPSDKGMKKVDFQVTLVFLLKRWIVAGFLENLLSGNLLRTQTLFVDDSGAQLQSVASILAWFLRSLSNLFNTGPWITLQCGEKDWSTELLHKDQNISSFIVQ